MIRVTLFVIFADVTLFVIEGLGVVFFRRPVRGEGACLSDGLLGGLAATLLAEVEVGVHVDCGTVVLARLYEAFGTQTTQYPRTTQRLLAKCLDHLARDQIGPSCLLDLMFEE